jgi:hypothetical protein
VKRDLTQDQFEYRATKLGFRKGGFIMGYWSLACDPAMHVSILNAGRRRRDQLRYLIAENKRHQFSMTHCPDCGGTFEDHNAVNRVTKIRETLFLSGIVAHSKTGGACWKSINSVFTYALRRHLKDGSV